MENFIYSINVTFPIFLVMVIGYFLKQIGMLNDNFVTVANRFNFKVTLPFMLFRDIAGVDIRAVFDLKYVLFCALVSTACFWLIWGGVKLFLKDQTMRGAFVQASFRSSAAVMGLAFIQNIYGTSAMGPLMIVSAVPLYNIFSVIVLTFEGENASGVDGKQKIKEACIGIAKNPIILGILAGLIVGLLGIEFPTIINKTVNSMAQMATPLALITIGAGFEGRKALAKIKPTIAASLIKLVIQPLIFLPVAVWMGFGGEKMIAILIMLASDNAELLYHGKEHEQRRCADGECDRDDNVISGIYADRMDLYLKISRVDWINKIIAFPSEMGYSFLKEKIPWFLGGRYGYNRQKIICKSAAGRGRGYHFRLSGRYCDGSFR